jgi:hypothetical protein
VTDYAAIAGQGIASTPGIVIDRKVVHADRCRSRKTPPDGGWRLNVKKMEPETTQPLAVSERHDGGRSFLARGPRSSTAQGASNLGHRVRKSWLTAFFMLWGGESIAMIVRIV